jgi:hypothetical protein
MERISLRYLSVFLPKFEHLVYQARMISIFWLVRTTMGKRGALSDFVERGVALAVWWPNRAGRNQNLPVQQVQSFYQRFGFENSKQPGTAC